MPSFLKKLFLGKELSNPYVNQYHPGHRATPQPAQQLPTPMDHASDSHPTSLNSSTRVPSRPVSPTYLEEARRLAGRDPVTGRTLSQQQWDSYAARSGQSISPTGRGNPQPRAVQQSSGVSHATGGGAVAGGNGDHEAIFQAEQHQRRALEAGQQGQEVGARSDVLLREERRQRIEQERMLAERLRVREMGGYFAPERTVREYYGGS